MEPSEVKVEWYRKDQLVNMSANCCRITHIKTGLCVTCDEYKLKNKNRFTALKELDKMVKEYYIDK